MKTFLAIIGSLYFLIAPGLALTLTFLKNIDWLDRLILSFTLSITVVPLVIIYLNLTGLLLTLPLAIISTAVIITISLLLRDAGVSSLR